jgi:hypothetical protein
MLSRVEKTGWRLAALAVLVWAAWMPVEGRTVSRRRDVTIRPTFEANVLVAALPSVLTPPAVQPGWRLISMIADDIDADGDLDVVANDGSLDLIVWINDGTGRLTRQETRQASDVQSDASAPGFANQPVGSETFVHIPFSFLQPDSSIASILVERSRPRWDGSTDALQPAFVSGRTPRAPPISLPLT